MNKPLPFAKLSVVAAKPTPDEYLVRFDYGPKYGIELTAFDSADKAAQEIATSSVRIIEVLVINKTARTCLPAGDAFGELVASKVQEEMRSGYYDNNELPHYLRCFLHEAIGIQATNEIEGYEVVKGAW